MTETKVIREKQDLTYLNWSHIRSSSGTAGTFLKSESIIGGEKVYYKLSNFDSEKGVIGHECVNEIIVDRLLTILGVEHLHYELIHADIEVGGKVLETYLCASRDFKKRGESKVALDDYYRVNKICSESQYDFCIRQGWKEEIHRMIAVDYIILNRDRHGANIEILRNPYAKTLRMAPLFDHGLSLLYSCCTEAEVSGFDVMKDLPCQNFIGGRSCYENLSLVKGHGNLFANRLTENDREIILAGLDGVVSDMLLERIWMMILERYKVYEEFRNIR